MHDVERDGGSWYLRRGRISRRTYWLHYALPITAASLAAVVLDVSSGLAWYSTSYSGGYYGYAAQETYAGGPFMLLTSLALLVPSVSALVARLHDRGRSAWWLMWGLVPFAGGIVLLVCTLQRGDEGPNGYGFPEGSGFSERRPAPALVR
ncbi:DUF805 domain-containing protein [Trujillonella humicola]|uniref:DUF805 domain-containing protein n=1 Tax=Trujillonella humicola TaxID=3383699 RepID=UPI003905924F